MKIIFVNPPLFWSDLYSEWDLSKVDSISPPIGFTYARGCNKGERS